MVTGKIVGGADGSQPGLDALIWAAREASRRGIHLLIAHAGDVRPLAEKAMGDEPDLSRGPLREAPDTAEDATVSGDFSTVFQGGALCQTRT